MRPSRRHAPAAPTKAALRTALVSALIHRRHGKPLSPTDIAGLARSYGRTEAQVLEAARDAGCEVLSL